MPLAISRPLHECWASFVAVMALIISIRAKFENQDMGNAFVGAIWLLLVGMILIGLNRFAIIERNWITEYTLEVGSIMQFALLTYIMVDRFQQLQQDNIKNL